MKTFASALALLLVIATAGAASAQPASPSQSPSPTPVTTAVPVATPEPTLLRAPVDPPRDFYREGVSGEDSSGVHPLRVFAAAGMHAFFGEGWNEKSGVPGEDPPETNDYLGGGLRIGASYEFTPSIAAVAQAGGHQGRHAFGEESDPEPVSVAYGLYYVAGGARYQTRPRQLGAYAEGGGGFAMGRVIVTRPDATDDAAEDESYPTFLGYGAVGLTGHVGPGMDIFVEGRFMTAPHGADSFTSDHELDLGGFTGSAGISIRL